MPIEFPLAGRSALCAAACAAAFTAPVAAQPFSVSATAGVLHDTNLLRLRGGEAPPVGLSKSDTALTAAISGGLELPLGRQRLEARATLGTTRYADNEALSSETLAARLGLALETAGDITGSVALDVGRRGRPELRDRNGVPLTEENDETSTQFDATLRYGASAPLGANVGFTERRVRYAADASAFRDYDLTSLALGAHWRPGATLTFSAGLRRSEFDYRRLFAALPNPVDRRTREAVSLGVLWDGGPVSRVEATIARADTEHERFAARDFSATTGSVVWRWSPRDAWSVKTTLARDAGQDAGEGATAFTRTSDRLRVDAALALTAKVSLSAHAEASRRVLDGNGLLVAGVTGRDRSGSVGAGFAWSPTRTTTLGCNAAHDQRGSNSDPRLEDAFSATRLSCFATLALR